MPFVCALLKMLFLKPVHRMSESSNNNDVSNSIRNARKQIRDYLKNFFETLFRAMFFWIKDDNELGVVIREIHRYCLHAVVIWYVLLHTFLPSYWLLVGLWALIGLVWLSHLATGTCVISSIERKLTGESITILDPILNLFGIPLSRECRIGTTISFSTLSFLFLSFELWTRSILNLKNWSYLLLTPSYEKAYSYIG
jgi:hypothetical protein